jgi:hypothetical protein
MITPTKKFFSICCGAIMYNWPDEQRCPLCFENSGAEDLTDENPQVDDMIEERLFEREFHLTD